MWANNEVGTLQPIDEVVAIAAEHGIPVHTDAVQAVGRSRSTSPARGVDALTLTGHKVGGPYGVGALVVRRELDVTPLVHGGGQERDIRSGTLDTPGDRRLRRRCRARGQAAGRRTPPGSPPCATTWCAGSRARCPTPHLHGDALTGGAPAAGQRPPRVPRLRGRLAADAARRPRDRVLHRLRLLGGRTAALARAARDGRRRRGGAAARCGSPSATPAPQADVDALVDAIGPGRRARRGGAAADERARRRHVRRRRLRRRRCACRRGRPRRDRHPPGAVAQPGVYRSGRRGCCTIEDANDARRAADVIGIPFYVWDLSERFHEDVVEDFVAEYAAGRTPNPCLRCNEKIKFAAVLDRAARARLRRGRHRPLRAARDRRRRQIELHRAADHAKDQSYVLGVLDQQQLATRSSRWVTPARPRSARRRAQRGLLVADKPDSHDICFVGDGDNAGWLRERLGDGRPTGGASSTTRPARSSAATTAPSGSPSASARACASDARPPDGKPRFVLDIEPVSGTVTVGPRERAHRRPRRGPGPRWCGSVPSRAVARHRPAARARRRAPSGGDRRPGRRPRRAARPGVRHRARPGGGVLRRHTCRRVRTIAPLARHHLSMIAATGTGSMPGDDQRGVRRGGPSRPRRAARPAAPARGPRPRGARRRHRTHAGRGGRARRRPAAGGLAAHRCAPGSTTAAPAACSPRTSTPSRSRRRASGRFKIQVAGPWTLAATVEKPRGDQVLADRGARRELAQALAEGVRGHVADLRRRLPDADPRRPGRRAVAAGGAGRRGCRRRPASAGTGPCTRPRPAWRWSGCSRRSASPGAEPSVHAARPGRTAHLARGAPGAAGVSVDLGC